METFDYPSDDTLYQAIMEMQEPVIFPRILQETKGEYAWELLEWSLNDLANKFGDIKLPFRIGYNARTMGPQWEINCSTVSMTLSEFVEKVTLHEDDKNWYYFDYKYIHEWFNEKIDIINSINWKRFGINKNGDDSTIWIGNKGAHTNCHQDSYGCNLVAQIHGRKQWLLFPPSSSSFLQPTRIPYEESTVYSKYNFFCPTKEDQNRLLSGQNKPQTVTLEPGDVLFIPPGWWHYVESLDLTVSVNMWLPISTDNVSRVKEAIVKLIVSTIGKNVCSMSEENDSPLSYCTNLLNITLKEFKNMENVGTSLKKLKRDTWTAKDLASEYPVHVKLLCELSKVNFEEFLISKRERFFEYYTESATVNSSKGGTERQNTESSIHELSKNIVNAFCHPDVVNKVADLLLS